MLLTNVSGNMPFQRRLYKTRRMIYVILTVIWAIFNLLCLVNIQAEQLALEGC